MVQQDTEVTQVVFRVWRNTRCGVIALFPTVAHDHAGYMCTAYEHVGQHSEASRGFYLKETTPLRDPLPYDALALLSELRNLGYSLRVVQRIAS